MDNQPLVSIIIPCYNAGAFINESVSSVLRQTYKNHEIIIVNDGSTDTETIKILHTLNLPKTKVYHTQNGGPSAARNYAIERSSGKYILPLDADDKIGSTYLEKAVSILESHPNIGIVYCRAEFFGKKTGEWILPPYSKETILLENMIFATAFYRRTHWQKVGGYNTNMIYGMEDYDFWLSLIDSEDCDVYKIDEILFSYRIKDVSRSLLLGVDNRNVLMFTQLFYNHTNLFLKNNNMKILIENRLNILQEIKLLRKIFLPITKGRGFINKYLTDSLLSIYQAVVKNIFRIRNLSRKMIIYFRG